MKAEAVGRKLIKAINQIINMAILSVILLMIAYAGYALWDADQLHSMADRSHYAVYKPSVEDEGKSFMELQAINDEVIGWLTVYGTHIDYPVTHGPDNMKYINTTADGRYSLIGSIFLDCGNKRDFSDFNNILHGHHMARNMMFGELGTFAEKKVFDAHEYGSLYFSGKYHGVEFFAFLHDDAYNNAIYTPGVTEKNRQGYLDYILTHAMYTRDIGVTTDDNIVLLSTCSSGSTNGRDLLIGRITDNLFEDPFTKKQTDDGTDQTSEGNYYFKDFLPLIILLAALLIVLILVILHRRKNNKKELMKKELKK